MRRRGSRVSRARGRIASPGVNPETSDHRKWGRSLVTSESRSERQVLDTSTDLIHGARLDLTLPRPPGRRHRPRILTRAILIGRNSTANPAKKKAVDRFPGRPTPYLAFVPTSYIISSRICQSRSESDLRASLWKIQELARIEEDPRKFGQPSLAHQG